MSASGDIYKEGNDDKEMNASTGTMHNNTPK